MLRLVLKRRGGYLIGANPDIGTRKSEAGTIPDVPWTGPEGQFAAKPEHCVDNFAIPALGQRDIDAAREFQTFLADMAPGNAGQYRRQCRVLAEAAKRRSLFAEIRLLIYRLRPAPLPP